MTVPPSPADDPLLEWDEAGAPRSRLFGDIYFSRQDGLAESRAVFLEGCGLPDAWQGRSSFTVGELGFGTGLNIAALLDLWRREGSPGAHLHIFSVEAFPLSRETAARALSAWPQIAPAADALTAHWPAQARGFRRVELPGFNATLDLAVMDVAEALAQWAGRADAWFLDGFSPSTNPQMWGDEVLALIAAKSAPGARVATFTVAGAVRRGLAQQGFTVEKKPGHGRKRERLEASLPQVQSTEAAKERRVVVIGSGVAGAALARAFRRLGRPVTVIAGPPGASENPAALVSPRLDAGAGPVAELSAQAFARAIELYRQHPAAIIARGALQLESMPRDAARFDAIASGDAYRDCGLVRVDDRAAGGHLGEPTDRGGLWLEEALTLEPAALLADWLHDCDRIEATVDRLDHDGQAWQVISADGELLAAADCVCLAAGLDTGPLADVNLQAVRGQVSHLAWPERPEAAAWGGYLVATRRGVLFGATHDRDDESVEVRPADHDRNLAQLGQVRPALAARLEGAPLHGRAGVRAASPDRLPLAGPLPGPAGLYVLSGLGGRGFTFAPLLAEHVAAVASAAPSPLPLSLHAIVDPDRFRQRQQRRAGRR